MNRQRSLLGVSILLTAGLHGVQAKGQAVPTATASVQLSAFGGISGIYTGVGLAKNLSFTGGGDVTFRAFHGLYPSAEVRGTYPINRGHVDAQQNILGGLNVSRHLGVLQPYGDILFGRGQIDFNPPLLDPAGQTYYVQTASNVISPGGGVNFFPTAHFGLKGDFQLQRYKSPVTTSGSVYAKSFTLGIVYRINAGGLGRLRHF